MISFNASQSKFINLKISGESSWLLPLDETLTHESVAAHFMKNKREYRKLEGAKFGHIEVLNKNGYRGNNVLWHCKCHSCGREFDRIGGTLRNTTKSCGCVRRHRGKDSPHWRGVGDISGANFKTYKANAIRRGIFFGLTIDYMWELYLIQKGKCALSGIDIVFGRTGRDENTASLDRINSKSPYEVGNVQWVHKHINMMKLDHDENYFLSICKLIADYNKNE